MTTNLEIQNDVMQELRNEPFLNANEIGITVKSGVVTLTGTVDSYLQAIVVNTIDTTSSLQAYEEAKLKAQTLNSFLDKIEERRNKPEIFIKDLVSSFLIPDV